MIFRKATPEDTDSIMKLEAECMPHPWVRSDIEALTKEPLKEAIVADNGKDITGYIGLSFVEDEAEVGNICVSPENRRQGIASDLLDEACLSLRSKGIKTLFLEVSSDNEGAIGLYKKKGFGHYNTRKGYYGDSDAMLMRKDISQE